MWWNADPKKHHVKARFLRTGFEFTVSDDNDEYRSTMERKNDRYEGTVYNRDKRACAQVTCEIRESPDIHVRAGTWDQYGQPRRSWHAELWPD
jgi:hypothetical protein